MTSHACGLVIKSAHACGLVLKSAMLQGTTNPVEVTQRILDYLCKHNSAPGISRHARSCAPADARTDGMRLSWFSMWGEGCVEAAEASRERWRRGQPLSVLDGVPYAIKDNQDAEEYPTCCGTTFLHEW
jgi:Asp-tRNA(Asn)/Glu-tRNA(Gln) amidotransferase A subunit family amidase